MAVCRPLAARDLSIGEARAAVFEYQYSDGGFLALLPADGEYDADPGCWRLDPPVGATMEYRTVTLVPGESHTSDLELYAAGVEDDSCLPVGEHRFETRITRYADPEDPGAGQSSATWGSRCCWSDDDTLIRVSGVPGCVMAAQAIDRVPRV